MRFALASDVLIRYDQTRTVLYAENGGVLCKKVLFFVPCVLNRKNESSARIRWLLSSADVFFRASAQLKTSGHDERKQARRPVVSWHERELNKTRSFVKRNGRGGPSRNRMNYEIKIAELAETFPTLQGAPLRPWDARAFESRVWLASRGAIRFVCVVHG